MGEVFKSPRKAEEEALQYGRDRFEAYMSMVDDETLPRAIALRALREEQEYLLFVATEEATDGEKEEGSTSRTG